MAKSRIPRSARKGLKRALIEDGGAVADSKKTGKYETKKIIRQGIQTGDIKRTKITWTVSVGDLVKVKSNRVSLPISREQGMPLYGIVTYKHNRVNYQNQEDEYIIVMTPHVSDLRIHPKQVEVIQE